MLASSNRGGYNMSDINVVLLLHLFIALFLRTVEVINLVIQRHLKALLCDKCLNCFIPG